MILLVSLLKAGGITALTVGVMYLLYSKMIDSGYFQKMSGRLTFCFFTIISILVFLTVNITFGGPLAFVSGDGVIVNQNGGTN